MTDLDNFSGQAQQIQQEILNGVQDGVLASRTVPIDDDDPVTLATREPPTAEMTPKNPTTRWANVDASRISGTAPRNPSSSTPQPPTRVDQGT